MLGDKDAAANIAVKKLEPASLGSSMERHSALNRSAPTAST
jgi:hypothetical protein